MRASFDFKGLERSIVHDRKFISTVFSFLVVGLIFLNLSSFNSIILGVVSSIVYFLINGTFLGSVFFSEEGVALRLTLGVLLLVALLGLVGWLVMIIYNLDILRSVLVLFIVTAFCSLMNRVNMLKKV